MDHVESVQSPKETSNLKRKSNTTDVAPAPSTSSAQEKATKKQRTTRDRKGKSKQKEQIVWPEYFNSLFKIYKALNTVLAFVSSRKHLATTFPVVRSSVEGLLKQPLELAKVAELKALLPDLIKFAYIPHDEFRINADLQGQSSGSKSKRTGSPDFSAFATSGSSLEEEEHVLILEFAENSRGKKIEHPGSEYFTPPSMSPAAVKRLVERRNERFCKAVEELILATPSSEDPVALVQAAGRDRIPINPSSAPMDDAKTKFKNMIIPGPQDRPTIDAVISEIKEQEWYKDQIVERRTVEPKDGQIGQLDPPLSDTIMQALKDSRKITALYTHQVAAISALSRGKNVIVSTSTASGKSVIYQVPVLRFLEDDRNATAIFVYPTKALAQDQRTALELLLCSCPGLEHVKVATYDGDTPLETRTSIRETSSVIFTNFDMIHASILPHEDLWRPFLKNLKLVAVDELHYYSNLFGSHVAQVMRRFRRVCAAVGNRRTRFVSCSATISKPMQHMKNIFGIDDVEEVTDDGAPSGVRDFLIWNPSATDPMEPKLGRESPLSQATCIMRFLMKRGVRVILFCKIRKVCELAMKTLRTELSAEGRIDVLDRVMSYRGGYSQQDRRRIEHEAFSGHLLGIVATNALELGVDIGVLDAVIMLGFPVSIASFRQQSGRAGRRARDSLAVLVADNLPIDQGYVEAPHELFDQPTEDLIVDLESKIVLEAHLQCAGEEMPLSLADEEYFGPLTRELCETKLTKDKDGWYHTHPKYLPFPSRLVAIRGAAEEEKYAVIDISKGRASKILEEVEMKRALFEVYEGAVFIHQGLTFIVKEVSHDTKVAKVIRADVSWVTTPRDFTDIDPVQTYRIREIKGSPLRAFYGRVDVKTSVFGFFKVRNNKILDIVDLETQPWQNETTGMWIDVPKSTLQLMKSKRIHPAGAIHAAEHALLNRFALAVDLRTECKVPEKEYKKSESARKRPARLIFYDQTGKTSTTAAMMFDHVNDLLRKANETVENCPCPIGCVKCVQSPSCKEGNEVCSKLGAYIILRTILALDIDADSIPEQVEEFPVNWETVVEASNVRAIIGIQIETVDIG